MKLIQDFIRFSNPKYFSLGISLKTSKDKRKNIYNHFQK